MRVMKTIRLPQFFPYLVLVLFIGLTVWRFWPIPTESTRVRQVAFDELPGWKLAHLQKSLLTFQTSCKTFVRQDPERLVGTEFFNLKAKDWQPACQAALQLNPVDEQAARAFFEQWFVPVEFYESKPIKGLFTGYYLPLLKGSYTQSEQFNIPIYEVPDDMITVDLTMFSPQFKNNKIVGRLQGNKLLPYYTRAEIDKGAVKQHARVLLWVNDPIDRLFMEIQGSGIVELEDGKQIYVGYDGQNGFPYTSMASVLIRKGVMTRENASMQGIRAYLDAHPEEREAIINQNQSFVFFRKLTMDAALGSQGVALTPGYSLAIDKEWIPMGAPLWLSTSVPNSRNPDINKPMHRLMIAQDTGGAIRGKIRGDVYWGGGDKASVIAGHMKNEGHYWLLLPKTSNAN